MSWVGMDQKSSSSNPLTTHSCSSPTATTARLLYFFGAMLSLLLTQSNFEVKLHSSPLLLLLQIFVNFFVHFKIWDMPWHSHHEVCSSAASVFCHVGNINQDDLVFEASSI